jgi:hypothetical protein
MTLGDLNRMLHRNGSATSSEHGGAQVVTWCDGLVVAGFYVPGQKADSL